MGRGRMREEKKGAGGGALREKQTEKEIEVEITIGKENRGHRREEMEGGAYFLINHWHALINSNCPLLSSAYEQHAA